MKFSLPFVLSLACASAYPVLDYDYSNGGMPELNPAISTIMNHMDHVLDFGIDSFFNTISRMICPIGCADGLVDKLREPLKQLEQDIVQHVASEAQSDFDKVFSQASAENRVIGPSDMKALTAEVSADAVEIIRIEAIKWGNAQIKSFITFVISNHKNITETLTKTFEDAKRILQGNPDEAAAYAAFMKEKVYPMMGLERRGFFGQKSPLEDAPGIITAKLIVALTKSIETNQFKKDLEDAIKSYKPKK